MVYFGPQSPHPPGSGPFGQPAPRPPRPATVTLAAALLLLEALMILAGAAIVVATRDRVAERTRAQMTEWGLDGAESAATLNVAVFITAGLIVLPALVLVALALLNLRGSNPARIATWVLCGILLCCSGFHVLGTAATTGADPSWYHAYQLASVTLSTVIFIGVILLLLLPASNNFFKPRQPGHPPNGAASPWPTGYQSPSS